MHTASAYVRPWYVPTNLTHVASLTVVKQTEFVAPISLVLVPQTDHTRQLNPYRTCDAIHTQTERRARLIEAWRRCPSSTHICMPLYRHQLVSVGLCEREGTHATFGTYVFDLCVYQNWAINLWALYSVWACSTVNWSCVLWALARSKVQRDRKSQVH